MTEQWIVEIGTKAIWVAMKVAAPVLIAALVVGLLVSILQAATQINEQTLSFIPKIIAMTAALVISGPWLLETMIGFTVELMRSIPTLFH